MEVFNVNGRIACNISVWATAAATVTCVKCHHLHQQHTQGTVPLKSRGMEQLNVLADTRPFRWRSGWVKGPAMRD